MIATIDFEQAFRALTGHSPFPWQRQMYQRFLEGPLPDSCNIPTGLGKTAVVAIWLIALANAPDRVPRRLVYVVNRRTVVDQTTTEAELMRRNAAAAGVPTPAISTLRGQFADNREWSADPSKPAIIAGTVDMIGSRLLFSGYGCGFKSRPLHAGFLGQDVLLVHDEAHLEPAFQELIVKIENEQKRCPSECGKFQVMELSATSRGEGKVFTLTDEEKNPKTANETAPVPLRTVWKRITAKKGLRFHSTGPHQPSQRNRQHRTSAQADWKGDSGLCAHCRRSENSTCHPDGQKRGAGVLTDQVQVLTGTLRGLERDRLAKEDPIFQRLLLKVPPDGRTVYLICTSAGEVGIDISADHMVCDLTPYDSMAQRLGRVNRRGDGEAEIDIVSEIDRDPKKQDDGLEKARWLTKAVLERLPKCDWIDDRYEASPNELSRLIDRVTEQERKGAFSPTPEILPVSDILFDAWALTTIKGKLPGRPPVEPYLHGISDYDPPQTTVAWREEVGLLSAEILEQNNLEIEDLLEAYPLKPHEELSGPTYGKNKVFEQLEQIAARDAKREPEKSLSAWVIDPDGSAKHYALEKLVEKDKQNKPIVSLGACKVILPPRAGGLSGGLLKGDEPYTKGMLYDVSGEWYADTERRTLRRTRVRSEEAKAADVEGMRLCCNIDLNPDSEEVPAVSATPTDELAENEEETANGRYWQWYVRPKSADDDGSKTAREPITWQHHTDDVTANTDRIAVALFGKDSVFHRAFVLAAKFHDLGKRRVVWQRSIGNPNPTDWYAKSGKGWKTREITDYRHEFGSLLDLEEKPDFLKLDDNDVKDLVRHLIAVHHGYGRPHFPEHQAFDPEPPKGINPDQIAQELPRRFARLQRKYGRWGLAYLESVLRAADWAASANPSKIENPHE